MQARPYAGVTDFTKTLSQKQLKQCLGETESGLRVVGAMNNKQKTGVCICFKAMQSEINGLETIGPQMGDLT